MTERSTPFQDVSIQVGGVFASRTPAVVRTFLGSCIAACLFDPIARVGGMNHFMLPGGGKNEGLLTRYGIHAMEKLINEILKLGGEQSRLRAKIFGAACVLQIKGVGIAIPERNSLFVKQFLANKKIPIVAQRLGGLHALQVYFFTDSGRARVRTLDLQQMRQVIEEEKHYFKVEIVKQLKNSGDEGPT